MPSMQLSKVHRNTLRESAISEEVIAERGYRTITDAIRLQAYGFKSKQANVPGLLVPTIWNRHPVSWQFRPDDPRKDDDGKSIKYESPAGSGLHLDCPPRASPDLENPAVDLWITEGAKKADAAVSAGLCCLSITGVDCWRAGGVPCEEWKDVALRGRPVYVAFDSDAMVKASVTDALDRLTLWLVSQGARVRHVRLPADVGVPGKAKVGLDDYLSAGHTVKDLYAQAGVPGKPGIKANNRTLPDLTTDALAALALANEPQPVVFQRTGELVERGQSGIVPFTRERLRYRLLRAADWYQHGAEGEKRPVGKLNPELVGDVSVARDEWPFPELDRIVHTPVFAENGSLRTRSGYHAASRTLYLPSADLKIPTIPRRPTVADVKRARQLINKLFAEFPFVSRADKAHAVALLLQPFARELIRGKLRCSV